MINRMICQTAPEERPETRIRFAEGETPMRSRPLRSATHCFPFAVRYLRLTSTPVEPKQSGGFNFDYHRFSIDAFQKSKSQVVIDLVSAADYFVGYVFFLHRIALLAAGDGLLPVRLPAGRQHPVHPVNPV